MTTVCDADEERGTSPEEEVTLSPKGEGRHLAVFTERLHLTRNTLGEMSSRIAAWLDQLLAGQQIPIS